MTNRKSPWQIGFVAFSLYIVYAFDSSTSDVASNSTGLLRAIRGLVAVYVVIAFSDSFHDIASDTRGSHASSKESINSATHVGHAQLLEIWSDKASGWLQVTRTGLVETSMLFVYASSAAHLVAQFTNCFPFIDAVLLANVSGAFGYGMLANLAATVDEMGNSQTASKIGSVIEPFFGVWTSFPALVQSSANFEGTFAQRLPLAAISATLSLVLSFIAFRVGSNVFRDGHRFQTSKDSTEYIQRASSIVATFAPLLCIFVTASAPGTFDSVSSFMACFLGCVFGNAVDAVLPRIVLMFEQCIEHLSKVAPNTVSTILLDRGHHQGYFLPEEESIRFLSQVLGNLLSTLVTVGVVRVKPVLPSGRLTGKLLTETETSFAGSASAFCGTMNSINTVYDKVRELADSDDVCVNDIIKDTSVLFCGVSVVCDMIIVLTCFSIAT